MGAFSKNIKISFKPPRLTESRFPVSARFVHTSLEAYDQDVMRMYIERNPDMLTNKSDSLLDFDVCISGSFPDILTKNYPVTQSKIGVRR